MKINLFEKGFQNQFKMSREIKNKHSQEEMVGFAIIIIVVAVILLVFLSIYLLKPSKTNLENYEIKSFINSFLEYTTSCENARSGYLPVRDVVFVRC